MEPDYKRQSAVAPPRLMAEKGVTICGLGTVGSNSAYQLAKLGTKVFYLIDFDNVEPHNLPSQQFLMTDVGRNKAEATKDQIESITTKTDVTVSDERLEGGEDILPGVVIFGFDSMESRRNVFDNTVCLNPSVSLLIDARMAGNNLQLFVIDPTNQKQIDHYRLFDFSDEHGSELPCGGETISYVGAMIGAMVANIVRQHVMGEPIPFGLTLNLDRWEFKNMQPPS